MKGLDIVSSVERRFCVLYGYISCQLRSLWPMAQTGNGRWDTQKKKEFWNRARHRKIHPEICEEMDTQVTRYVAECGLKWLRYNLVREEPYL